MKEDSVTLKRNNSQISITNRWKSMYLMWLSIDHRLTYTNQYQLTNWCQLISIDQLVFWWSTFIDCVRQKFLAYSSVSFQPKTRLALASVLGPFATFAEIHSTHPGALMHYSRFQSLVPTPVVNPDSSPPVQSPVLFTARAKILETYLYLSYDCDLWKP